MSASLILYDIEVMAPLASRVALITPPIESVPETVMPSMPLQVVLLASMLSIGLSGLSGILIMPPSSLTPSLQDQVA